jgi:hypothetical protein
VLAARNPVEKLVGELLHFALILPVIDFQFPSTPLQSIPRC